MSTQSLPSFAQAFSNHSLQALASNSNALPPIMHPSRKRTNDDDPSVRIKEEHDDPPADATPPPSLASPLKKRRTTVSGNAPHPLHIDVRPTHDQTSTSTPISPVVIGFSIPPDNIEQVRNMLSVKQKQKAIIDQRRSSIAGSPTALEDRSLPKQQQQQQQPQQTPAPRTSRRSPNSTVTRPSQRPPSPQQHSLPPPPISFARRRAAIMGGAKKPADIVIKPRDQHTRHQLQPGIQSAPPIPHAASQTSSFYSAPSGRVFNQMSLPRLPTIALAADNPRRVPGNVPPTPTRLSMQLQQNQPTIQPMISNNRSPPASVPIATTFVPPTPTSLHRPGYAGDKAAFLAPFDVFYDALNDSKQLKTWLAEQLQKSHTLMQSLAQQQERINETVESIVEKRVAGMKNEMASLRRRVDDLEDAMAQKSGRTHGLDPAPHKQINGASISAPAPEPAYTFPPASSSSQDPSSSSSRGLRPESSRPELPRGVHNRRQSVTEAGRASPARRTGGSSSTTRHEFPPGSSMQSPPQIYRERDAPVSLASTSNSTRPPPVSRQNSSSSAVPIVVVSGERERERTPPLPTTATATTASRRAPGSRRDDVVMTGPGEGS